MTDFFPITPPPELVEQWLEQCLTSRELAAKAFQAGADQELDACCEWLEADSQGMKQWATDLRADRRPKQPSLKEQALAALDQADKGLSESEWQQRSETIRRALEQLDD